MLFDVRGVLLIDVKRNQWSTYSIQLKRKTRVIFISKDAEIIPDSYILVRIEHFPELDEEKRKKIQL